MVSPRSKKKKDFARRPGYCGAQAELERHASFYDLVGPLTIGMPP